MLDCVLSNVSSVVRSTRTGGQAVSDSQHMLVIYHGGRLGTVQCLGFISRDEFINLVVCSGLSILAYIIKLVAVLAPRS